MDCKGIIPGPGESWREWEERARLLSKSVPNQTTHTAVLEVLEWHWGISPSWVEVKENTSGFWPWHAASCAVSEEGFITVTVNPGAAFFCSFDEILAHELSHAARSSFQEGCFDEHLAYALSSSSLRRFWGPFFSQKTWIPLLWVLSWFLPAGLLLIGSFSSVKITYALVGGGWFSALVRHYLLQLQYRKAWSKLREEFPEELARWMFFRLSEEEVLLLAEGSFCLETDLLARDEPRSRLFKIKIDGVERV
ncbi:hypothetical protein HAT2_00757 [Candidatus Similichlamydia laticola]|uniref:Uncharacterized protein n=2 Tax=Candidatus Similichlamydia laticola TaxID=2170265 RepID=A0A369K977_9BACT|nr:hypothetical protein HAT2_00757 [Candidatus Similichlamydia laticola]